MREELTTEDVENYLKNSGRFFVRLPAMGESDVAIDKAVGFLRGVEEEISGSDIDVIIFSRNALAHDKLSGDEKDRKSSICEKLAYRLHLDYLAYTEFIVSVPKNERNAEILRKLCLRYGLEFP